MCVCVCVCVCGGGGGGGEHYLIVTKMNEVQYHATLKPKNPY